MNKLSLMAISVVLSLNVSAQTLVPAQAYEHTFNLPNVTMSEDISCHAFKNPTNTAWGDVDVYLAGWGNGPVAEVTVQFTKPGEPSNVLHSEILPYQTGFNIAVGAIYNSNTGTMQVLVAYENDGFKVDIYDITTSPTNPLKFIDTKELTNDPHVNFGRRRIRMDSHIDRAVIIWDHPGVGIQVIGCDQGNWGNVLDVHDTYGRIGPDVALTEMNGVPYVRMVYYRPPAAPYIGQVISTSLDFNTVMSASNLIYPFGGGGFGFGTMSTILNPHLVIDTRDYDDYENWAFVCTFYNLPGVFVGYRYDDGTSSVQSGLWVNSGALGNANVWGQYNVSSPSLHYGGGPGGADQIMVGWYASNGSYNGYMGLQMKPDASGLISDPDYLEFTNATSPVYSLSGIAFCKEDKKLAPDYLYTVYYNRQNTSGGYDLHHAFHKWNNTVFKEEQQLTIESPLSNAYPNPFKSYISKSVNVPEDGHLKVNLADVTGKIVAQYNQQVKKGNQTIQIADLDQILSGTYYLSTFFNNGRIQTEVIVK